MKKKKKSLETSIIQSFLEQHRYFILTVKTDEKVTSFIGTKAIKLNKNLMLKNETFLTDVDRGIGLGLYLMIQKNISELNTVMHSRIVLKNVFTYLIWIDNYFFKKPSLYFQFLFSFFFLFEYLNILFYRQKKIFIKLFKS
jgi:hypothetical protein